jgi:PKD repeat protein
MKKLVLIFFTFFIALASCKKKEYPNNTITGTPEFYVKASVDGQPIMFQAGAFDYYMYSSYDQNVDGVYSFIANVKQKSCTGNNCPGSIKIELFDDQSSTQNGTSNINASIKPGGYQFVNSNTVIPTVVGYAVTYRGSYNLSANTYSWNFGYGAPATGTATSPTHTYATAGVYNVRFAAYDGTNWSYIDNPIKVTANSNACKAQILASPPSGNIINFSSQVSGSGNYSRLWEFGDGSMPSIDGITQHIYPQSGLYQATLTVVDHGNSDDTARHHYWVNTALSNDPAPNFYAEKVAPILSNSPISKIKITYTDGTGTIYYSDVDPQNSSSNFQIISVEDYKSNENNQATKKVKITFNCRLTNGVSAVTVTEGEAVVAVAYK